MPLYEIARFYRVERRFLVRAPTEEHALEHTEDWDEDYELTHDVISTEINQVDEEEE